MLTLFFNTLMNKFFFYFYQSDTDDLVPSTDLEQSTPRQNNIQNSEPIWADIDEAYQPRVLFNQMDKPVSINPDIIDCLSE